MKTDFETAKSILEKELKDAPHVKDCLFGNAASSRKIMDFVIQAIISNLDKSECISIFREILKENNIEDKYEGKYSGVVEMFFEILERYSVNR